MIALAFHQNRIGFRRGSFEDTLLPEGFPTLTEILYQLPEDAEVSAEAIQALVELGIQP